MDINIISIGTKMPNWVNEAFDEYQKRLSHAYTVTLTEVPLAKRTKNTDLKTAIAHESTQLQAACPIDCLTVALDISVKLDSRCCGNDERVAGMTKELRE